jgi:penicillin-binding protein 1A
MPKNIRRASFDRNPQTSHTHTGYSIPDRKKPKRFWKNFSLPSSSIFSLWGIAKILLWLFLLGSIAIGIVIFTFMRDIPSIDSIEKGDYFQENTTIYDKKWAPIYTLFNDGKRTYIGYDAISQSMKDAIVSVEDKTFFENPGIDIKWLARAGYNYITDKTDTIKGTSTLSQQLISKTLLDKERSIKRKVREAYLSYELNKNYSKEKILEMYLNRISFGNNANGIEEAAKTYFGKSAKDVWPLWASILASLPKWPTYYSPYSHRDRLMGEVVVYPAIDPTAKVSLTKAEARKPYERMYSVFKWYLSGITMEAYDGEVRICGINKDYVRNSNYLPSDTWCIDTAYDNLLEFVGDIAIRDDIVDSGSTISHVLEYTIGRKDFVAVRMFEDGKIDGSTFKKIIYDGLEFQFQKYSENIKHPYFVMYIKEYLENKYGKDIDITQGLKVYTTLDPDLQEKAESLVKKQATTNKTQYGAKSAALVSMDNKNGALLAMVWGPDYFDTENGGNNNMVIAKRQPGSSFKPIVYALAISKNPIGPLSPVADVKTKFSNTWQPENYDGKFKGVMTVEKALAYSRNIPAIKMYYLAWQEESIEKHAQTLGLKTVNDAVVSGGALALGAEEVRPIDLMQAYSIFANLGIKRDVYAIEKIVDSQWNTIEEYKKPEKEEPVFSAAASYILTNILANIEARPEGKWREYITIAWGRRAAVKTGTSDKKVGKLPDGDDKLLPRDLWTAWYTPQITTVVWAGNVDGKETYGTCDGLNCAAPIWRQYRDYAQKNLKKEDWNKPESVLDVTIVKSSGLLPTSSTPEWQKITTIMSIKPSETDSGFNSIGIDTLCNGPISENTPEGAIGYISIPNGKPVIDGYKEEWLSAFRASVGATGRATSQPCERPGWPGNINISLSIVGIGAWADSARKTLEWSWSWDRAVKSWSFIVDGETKTGQWVDNKTSGWGRTSIVNDEGEHTATFQVIDIYGFTYRESRTFRGGALSWDTSPSVPTTPSTTGAIVPPLQGSDLAPPIPSIQSTPTNPPQILLSNPRWGSVNLYKGDPFNLRFSISVVPGAREINVTLAGNTIKSATTGESFVVAVSTTSLEPGSYPIVISVIDSNLKTTTRSVNLTVLPK